MGYTPFAPSFFCVFLLPIACTLPAVVVTKARLRQKLASLCPFANCTKKQLFRRDYASIFLLLACSLFCAVFFCVFLLPIACTLPAVAVTKSRLLQKLSLCPFCKLYEKTTFSAWLYKHFPAFVRLFVLRRLFLRFSFADCMHLAGGCRNEGEITVKTRWLCLFANCTKKQLFRHGNASIFLLLSGSLFCTVFLHWKGVFRLSETGLNACAKYKRVLVFFIFGKSGAIGFFVLLFWAKFHFITSIFSGKNNQRQINIRL